MSSYHATRPQSAEPDRLNPVPGTHILGPSVEVVRSPVNDLCSAPHTSAARERILTWLAEGPREVTWALCSLPRERWASTPSDRPGEWPVLRHAHHLALRDRCLTLPMVRRALGDTDASTSPLELERGDATWNPQAALESAEDIVRGLGASRYELLQHLEIAPDDAWVPPVQLDRLMLDARQHELEHLAAMWRTTLCWDRVSLTPCRQA
jgi:hypothetical protein